jgi:hypothetical protein
MIPTNALGLSQGYEAVSDEIVLTAKTDTLRGRRSDRADAIIACRAP